MAVVLSINSSRVKIYSMRYLGIDYGSKRVGIAVSDAYGKIAFPKTTFYNRGNQYLFDQLKSFIKEESTVKIIVGLPIGLDGKDSDQTKIIRKFADKLKQEIGVPVDFENEMFTSHMVVEQGVKKEHTDQAAAAVILQSYLDKQNR